MKTRKNNNQCFSHISTVMSLLKGIANDELQDEMSKNKRRNEILQNIVKSLISIRETSGIKLGDKIEKVVRFETIKDRDKEKWITGYMSSTDTIKTKHDGEPKILHALAFSITPNRRLLKLERSI